MQIEQILDKAPINMFKPNININKFNIQISEYNCNKFYLTDHVYI